MIRFTDELHKMPPLVRRGLSILNPVALCLLVICCAVARAQKAELAPPPGAKVIDITERRGYFNEPSVAVNPLNPKQVVLAYQTGARVAYSEDAGENWQIAANTVPRNYAVSGDVSVAYDNQGHAFLCYIAFDKLGTEEYWGHNATRNGIFVRRSLDGGRTWQNPAAVIEHPTQPGIPFEDKPYIVADNTKGPYAGNLYVGWTQFTLTQSFILFSRSVDDGVTWSKPIRISTKAGLPRDDNGAVEGFTGAVGPDGTLYVVWADGTHVVFTYSRDGGRTFALRGALFPLLPLISTLRMWTGPTGSRLSQSTPAAAPARAFCMSPGAITGMATLMSSAQLQQTTAGRGGLRFGSTPTRSTTGPTNSFSGLQWTL